MTQPALVDGGGKACLAYLPLVVFAYATQHTVLPRLLGSDPAAAEPWWFGAPASVVYAADLLGYALFGVGAAVIGASLLPSAGLWRWLGWTLIASGATSVTGFAGFAVGVGWLELGSTAGGVLTCRPPCCCCFSVCGRFAVAGRVRRRARPASSGSPEEHAWSQSPWRSSPSLSSG